MIKKLDMFLHHEQDSREVEWENRAKLNEIIDKVNGVEKPEASEDGINNFIHDLGEMRKEVIKNREANN